MYMYKTTLWWSILFYGVTLANHCPIGCVTLVTVPSRWNYAHKTVPIIALTCSVKSKCSVDFSGLLKNYTDVSQVRSTTLISVDVYFNCLVKGTKFDFLNLLPNKSILVVLRLRNCKTTWEDISYVGEHYSLLEVEIILTPPYLPFPRNTQHTLIGLSHLAYLSLTLLNYTGKVRIEDMLPYEKAAMPSIGSLEVQCLNVTKEYCEYGVASYQPLLLAKLFPHLQMLSLNGVYPSDNNTMLNFPWDVSSIKYPFNLSHSRFNKEFAIDKEYEVTESFYFIRTMGITSNVGMNITNFCSFYTWLNTIILIRNTLHYIPPTCFSPKNNETSSLQILDLTSNKIGKFENDIFKNLTNLKVFHIAGCALTELQVGLFDDLSSLRILNLDYNHIQVLRAGLFSKLVSLKQLFIHQNSIYHIDPQTLPIYSLNLTLVDLRWNKLRTLPTDCLTLPNLYLCDCSINNITLNNLTDIIAHFDPVRMHIVQPMAYYREAYSHMEVGIMHETGQTVINLGRNKINGIGFNNSWSLEQKRRLAAFLSFFQINLESEKSSSIMECDCRLYHLKRFINSREAYSTVHEAAYSHVLLLSSSNFNSWKCYASPILQPNVTIQPFLVMPDELFICSNNSLKCPENCKCYSGAHHPHIVVDCSHKNLTTLPKDIPLPSSGYQLIVGLEHNYIVSYVNCEEPGYEWLQYVSKLNLQHNKLTPNSSVDTHNFLSCLKRTTHLYLANNNINSLPMSIQDRQYKDLSISGNKLKCDCTAYWMKEWLQDNNESIQDSLTIHCVHMRYSIVQLDQRDFKCEGILAYLGAIGSLVCLLTTIIIFSIASYNYEFEIKVLLFEKLNWHPFDKQENEENKEHDVYLMYCRADETWVINTLLTGLERLGYRTCVPDRDFTVGASTAAEMSKAFSKTHRVLVVISQSFINNRNAMSDFYHAYEYDRSTTRKRFLVLVKLRDKLKLCDSQEIFRRYLSTNYFISIQARSFWSRLRYWLPPINHVKLPAITDNIELEREDEYTDEPDEMLIMS